MPLKEYIRLCPILNVEIPFHKLGAQKCIKKGTWTQCKHSPLCMLLYWSCDTASCPLRLCLPGPPCHYGLYLWTVHQINQTFPPRSYLCQGTVSQQQEEEERPRIHWRAGRAVTCVLPQVRKAAWESRCPEGASSLSVLAGSEPSQGFITPFCIPLRVSWLGKQACVVIFPDNCQRLGPRSLHIHRATLRLTSLLMWGACYFSGKDSLHFPK